MFSNLDEDTKAKAEVIMEKERAGTITREEAQTQLKKLGFFSGYMPPSNSPNLNTVSWGASVEYSIRRRTVLEKAE
ncbi:hypothetical protein ACE198_00410 [Neobacillus sp. KR4-4]|uniref:hypothetical protein n=1 Tax=Neobacillus sp. KR4-4 TaxID=3344872 RepID=UPI0035CC0DC4